MRHATPPQSSPGAPGQAGLRAGPMAALVAAIGTGATALVLWFMPPFEGTHLVAYRDIGGVLSVCTGNTSDAQPGRTYTPAECEALLASDLVRHNKGLDGCVQQPLADHERAAYLSWAFNVGVGNACASTLVRKLNAGDRAGACAELSRWTYVRGRDCRAEENKRWCGGIVRRRDAERMLCEGRYPGAAAAPPGALL